ncbi:MAG TPA: hypothetical protein VFX07_11115 [Candidatus Udaeobacter sp.]|jgi:hypothetical protein|nr:hypothetical protein [Candidatus Udaeobacter sp.]
MQLMNLILLVVVFFSLLSLNALALAGRMRRQISGLTNAPE